MAVDIHNLIAAIHPDIYCDAEVRDKVKKLVQEKGVLEAAKEAKVKESAYLDLDEVALKPAVSKQGLKNPIEKYTLSYDSFGESLEPVYFWIVDTLQEHATVEKLVDNFISSPGSGHFSEMQARATRMQEEATRILGNVNTVIKSILNIVYDLKEFQMRLRLYEQLKSESKEERDAALLSLKQVWVDTVDFKRGTTSLKGLVQQLNYVTIIDAFMVADSVGAVEELDLNDRVKRILKQRVNEFYAWIEMSEKELRKRFEIEKSYLKAQIHSITLYARWAKPYLRAAAQLEQRATATASLVHVFNTALFELILLAHLKYKAEDDVLKGDLPKLFKKAKARTYSSVLIVELKFRSAPERATQQGGYGFRGRVDVTFTSYGLNEDELNVLREAIEKDDLNDVFKVIEGATDESLVQLQSDIDEFLGMNEKKKEKEEKEKASVDINPFSALFSFFKSEKKEKEKKDFSKGIPADSEIEKVLRSQAILEARKNCRKFYEIYKKAHHMPAF